MKIAIRDRQYGFFSTQPITVQKLEDGLVTSCNHDGYYEEDLPQERIASDGTVREWTIKAELCDKCYAWRQVGEEEWHDEV